jgi:phosphoribosylamine--glycine ligase
VILASGGYPGSYEKGQVISGLDAAGELEGVKVFHAGAKAVDGQIVTNGGRVLGVTALGANLDEARRQGYLAADRIFFDGIQRRNDIGA